MILKVLPPLIILLIGYLLKKFKIFDKEAGNTMLQLVFYVAQPAAILVSVSSLKLSWDLFFLPFLPSIISLIIISISFLVARKMHLPRKTMGSFLVGTAIMNTGFTIPFISAVYGSEGFAKMALFDVGNAIFVFSFVYYIAALYGSDGGNKKTLLKKLLFSAPLWAITIALALNFTKTTIDPLIIQTLQLGAYMIVPLLMLSLGIYFEPKILNFKREILAVCIRMGLGLILGYAFATLLGLEGITKAVVIIGASGPIGYNTLTFSKLEKLDEEFTANIISLSVIVAIILIPLLMYLINI
ncbi:MAG: AEC family transporter [Actinomycetota bacterium]